MLRCAHASLPIWPSNRLREETSTGSHFPPVLPRASATADLIASPAQPGAEDLAVGADQEDGRDGLYAVASRGAWPGTNRRESPGSTSDPSIRRSLRIGRQLVEAQADHDQAVILAEGVVGRLEVGRLGDAGAAPGRPEVEQHELAAVVGQP